MILGKRIRLRALEREDIPTFVRWFNDPELRHYLLMFEPMSKAKEEKWFDSMLERRDDFLFGIEAQLAERWLLIGNIGLHRVSWKDRHAVLGIALGEKEYWGKGYGTDAVRTMLRWAFHELDLNRVELEVFDYNPRARRCYEKAGFRLEGTRRQAHFHDGRYHDNHLMAVLRDEFEAGA
jgi:RimJ/RimL family protein N-acetyltransferase